MYEKQYMEKLSDKYDENLNEIPPTLKYDSEDTQFLCPICGGKLRQPYFEDPHKNKILIERAQLFCPVDKEYFYEQNIIWNNNNGGGGGTGGSDVRMIGNVLTIT